MEKDKFLCEKLNKIYGTTLFESGTDTDTVKGYLKALDRAVLKFPFSGYKLKVYNMGDVEKCTVLYHYLRKGQYDTRISGCEERNLRSNYELSILMTLSKISPNASRYIKSKKNYNPKRYSWLISEENETDVGWMIGTNLFIFGVLSLICAAIIDLASHGINRYIYPITMGDDFFWKISYPLGFLLILLLYVRLYQSDKKDRKTLRKEWFSLAVAEIENRRISESSNLVLEKKSEPGELSLVNSREDQMKQLNTLTSKPKGDLFDQEAEEEVDRIIGDLNKEKIGRVDK